MALENKMVNEKATHCRKWVDFLFCFEYSKKIIKFLNFKKLGLESYIYYLTLKYVYYYYTSTYVNCF